MIWRRGPSADLERWWVSRACGERERWPPSLSRPSLCLLMSGNNHQRARAISDMITDVPQRSISNGSSSPLLSSKSLSSCHSSFHQQAVSGEEDISDSFSSRCESREWEERAWWGLIKLTQPPQVISKIMPFAQKQLLSLNSTCCCYQLILYQGINCCLYKCAFGIRCEVLSFLFWTSTREEPGEQGTSPFLWSSSVSFRRKRRR